tara:strand:- start:1931 stop:2074 length:144 start_codon:yes stop_codon:yes gene_type:complete
MAIKQDDGWYFVDEYEQLDDSGPYDSKEEAEEGLASHIIWLNRDYLL